jgi:hypothetical protein
MADDLEWIVSTARQRDPSMEHDVAVALAGDAVARVGAAQDAPDLARQLLAAHPDYGATAANVVATAAFELVTGGA